MDLVPGPEGQLIKIWIRNSDENPWNPVSYEYGHGEVPSAVFLKLKTGKKKWCVKYLQYLQRNIQYRTVPHRILY
jgi:hypothetical protein